MAHTMTAEAIRRREESGGLARDTNINVGATERLFSGIGGAALLAYGLSRRTLRGAALAAMGGLVLYRGVTGYCGMYDALGIDTSGGKDWLTAGRDVHRGVKVEREFTIRRSPEDCYRFWRDLENLPRIMTHLISVQPLDERGSHWVAKAPAPWNQVEWDAEIINDRPNELIAWRSLPGADVDNAGSVRFRLSPDGRGTELTVALNYEPPAGHLGLTIARLFGEEPSRQVADDLGNFQRIMESGAPAPSTAAGQPSGR